ncbi:hypothetical protein GN244_ATG20409 [Phytophthora infestans]|uniref:Transmembrane protein n=1 Tax=Phytophthora infestans TaxID=4787 RepID=A0A833WC88_PHYIN|nr:hypothetical protein GN244_ATG20409 [Phytophthora infestans]
MKIQPEGEHETIASKRQLAFLWLLNYWHRSQIGHRSEYSVERLLAFRDYYKRASFSRVVAVCILTPIPAISVTLLIDCTPLKDPSEGWHANYAFWFRWFLALVAVSVGVTLQVREAILPGVISNTGAAIIALGTSLVDVSMTLAVAVLWQFPIPFGYILMVGPYLLIVLSFTLLVVGRQRLTESPILCQQIKAQATIIFAQGAVAMAYPVFTAVFYQLSGPQQTVFIIVIPIFKQVTKVIIANAAGGLHEYVGPIVVFSVDVFNVFYVAICMQISKTMLTTLLIIASDGFHVLVALRDIFHQTSVLSPGVSCSINYLEDLPVMLRKVFKTPKILSRIRIFAPFPLPLSDDSRSFLALISRAQQKARALAPPRLHKIGPSILQAAEAKPLRELPSAPTRLLTLMHPHTLTSAKVLRSTMKSATTDEASWDALQALFHSEYLLMTEYIECILPLLYAIYLPILFELPAAPYYPQTASSTPDKLKKDVVNILMFGAVEMTGFVGLLFLLKRKFGISPLFQLAFVLETQMRTVQGHLFVWTVFILHMPLMHYGVNYAVQFN